MRRLEEHGDRQNSMHARLVAARRLLLLGRLDEASDALDEVSGEDVSDSVAAGAELARVNVAMRRVRTREASAALDRAQASAERAGIPALLAEVTAARAVLVTPAARLSDGDRLVPVLLREIEGLLGSGSIVVDACRRTVRAGDTVVSLVRRPILCALARGLAEAWPQSAARESLIASVFGVRRGNDSHRSRLRVEVGRLRAALGAVVRLDATRSGFELRARPGQRVVLLLPPIDGEDASVLAVLSDGSAWSTSALALALGESQRTVQRALARLQDAGRVRSIGSARSRRWLAPPVVGFSTSLLLPGPLPLL